MNTLRKRLGANLERADSPDAKLAMQAKAATEAPPVSNSTWCGHYNEEWAAFLAANTRRKSAATARTEPEILPRVWNAPHH